MKRLLLALLPTAAILAACGESPQDRAEDKVEAAADASAASAGPAVAALGLTEAQLLDADLIGPNGVDLGDVASVSRGPDGQVNQLLVEIEDSNPDRYVYVPVAGLTVVARGDDQDLSTTMTREALAALPAVDLATVAR